MSESNPAPPGESLRDKILQALDGLLVLHVTTAVGQATVRNSDQSGAVSMVVLTDANPRLANTVINTALGDGTTIYTPEFLADTALMAAHKEAVQAAHDVRKETIAMLKTVLEDFKEVLFPKQAAH
jgi:hypothetical protein